MNRRNPQPTPRSLRGILSTPILDDPRYGDTLRTDEPYYGVEVAAANDGLTGANQVQALTPCLDPAATQIVETLQTPYGIRANANPSECSSTPSTNLYLNPGRTSPLDPVHPAFPETLDTAGTGADRILVARTGKAHTLAPDTDVLIAGEEVAPPLSRRPGPGTARGIAALRNRQGRRRALLPALLCVATLAASPVRAAPPDPSYPFPFSYHFTLTKGRHRPVCQADLKRLNEATYTGPPSCDQPQTTQVPGFTPLHPVMLSAPEVYALFNRVDTFIEHRTQRGGLAVNAWLFPDVQNLVHLGATRVWRYEPPISIDNDGRPTPLVVWQGLPIPTSGTNGIPWSCGHAFSVGADSLTVYDQSQIALILAPNRQRLNVRATMAIFGRPGVVYQPFDLFQPIGWSTDFFEYRGRYYFDAFLGQWGSSNLDRLQYPALTHTLGVFLRQHGHTHEVCEYHMTVHHLHSSE